MVEALHDVDQADGVDIKYRRGVRIVAQFGRVSGEAKDVAKADGGGAEQVRLNTEKVAVAAGVVEDGLDVGELLNLDAETLGAHAGRGARRIGYIDGVDAKLRQQLGAFDLLDAVD